MRVMKNNALDKNLDPQYVSQKNKNNNNKLRKHINKNVS